MDAHRSELALSVTKDALGDSSKMDPVDIGSFTKDALGSCAVTVALSIVVLARVSTWYQSPCGN